MPPPVAHDLLQPSLSGHAVRQAPYNLQVGFLVAFFGGPAAALGLATLNAHRVGRLWQDRVWLLPALLIWLVFEAWWMGTPSGWQFNAAVLTGLGSNGPRHVERGVALLGFVLSSLLHRREQQAAAMMGLDRPNGWIAGSALIIGGWLVGWLKEGLA